MFTQSFNPVTTKLHLLRLYSYNFRDTILPDNPKVVSLRIAQDKQKCDLT